VFLNLIFFKFNNIPNKGIIQLLLTNYIKVLVKLNNNVKKKKYFSY
jgi:hypothetical protein